MSLTSGEVMDEAALLLNDAAKITFTYAVQAPWLRRAVNEYSDELAVNSIPLLRKISTTAPLLSGNASVPLPSDALLPIMLEERAYGSSEAFSGMTQLDTIPVNQTAGNSLDFWAFEGTLFNSVPVINTPGATSSREVRITYQKFLPYSGIVDGTTDFSTSIAANSKRFLASKVAELISRFVLQNVARGNELKSESGQSLYRIIQIWTKFRQRTPIRKGRYNNPTPFDTPFNYPQISSGGGSGPVSVGCADYFINIKCSPYNAVGDGITDDTVAIKAAIADLELAGGGMLIIPVGKFLISSELLFTKPVRVMGCGLQSKIIMAATVGAGVDAIRFAPVAGGGDFSFGQGSFTEFSNFAIIPNSGNPGRHGICIDISTAGVTIYVRELTISRMWIGRFGGRGIALLNGTQAAPVHTDGLFCSTIKECYIDGGIQLIAGGDSINIINNILTGANAGVEADIVAGGAKLIIAWNNITNLGGAVWLKNGYAVSILDNQIEQNAARAGGSGNNAIIDLVGPATGVLVQGNTIGATFVPLTVDCIRVDNCLDTVIQDNVLGPPLIFHAIVLTANQIATLIGKNSYNLSAGGGEFTAANNSYTNIIDRGYQLIAFAAAVTPNTSNGTTIEIGALTGNITINAPINSYIGRNLTFLFTQDGVGGRTVTWDAAFTNSWVNTGNTAGKKSSISFVFNGSFYVQANAQRLYA